MCEGTRCTHHIDPAVEEVEADYDSWEYVRTPFYDPGPGDAGASLDSLEPSAYVLTVLGRNSRENMSHGPSHDQPMILMKDDIGRCNSDEDMRRVLYCTDCASGGHKCYGCHAPITHMASGRCLDCVNTYESELSRMIRTNT